MITLFAVPAAALLVILGVSIAPIFDFRRRPLPGSMGTCNTPAEPDTEAVGEGEPAGVY